MNDTRIERAVSRRSSDPFCLLAEPASACLDDFNSGMNASHPDEDPLKNLLDDLYPELKKHIIQNISRNFNVDENQSVSENDGFTQTDDKAAYISTIISQRAMDMHAAFMNHPWLTIAEGELWQQENKGQPNNPRIIEYHSTTSLKAQSDETPWCSSFVNWCLQRAGVTGTNSAKAISWLDWGQDCGPREGAVTVLFNAKAANSSLSASGNHVGFLVKETDTHYTMIGGNQRDMVIESDFPKATWLLKGFRWPKP